MLMPVEKYGTLDFAPEKMDALLAMGLKVADSVFAQASCLNPLNKTGRRPLELRATWATSPSPARRTRRSRARGSGHVVLADLGP
jgi:hypothetical protein